MIFPITFIKKMIQLIVTGGTFDKTYDHIKGELYFEHTHITKMLERSRCKLPIHVTPLLLKDSLAFTEEDLQRIEKACTNTSAKSIVITLEQIPWLKQHIAWLN